MLGWVWSAGTWDQCAECRTWVRGVWRHFVTALTSNLSVCAECAGGAG